MDKVLKYEDVEKLKEEAKAEYEAKISVLDKFLEMLKPEEPAEDSIPKVESAIS